MFAMGSAFIIGIGFAVIQNIFYDLPKLDQVEDYKPYQVSRVFDSSNNLIAEYYVERRTLVYVKSLPVQIKNAFLAAEDADFYRHQGIDYFGILRALANEVKYQHIWEQYT